MLIEGSSGGSGQGVNPPQTSITGPASGPAFYINGTLSGLTMRNPHEHSLLRDLGCAGPRKI